MIKLLFVRRVLGQSMQPTLTPGKIIFASAIKPYEKGSLVIARVNGIEVVKRIKQCGKNKVWLVSDNLKLGKDSRHYGPLSKRHIIGTLL